MQTLRTIIFTVFAVVPLAYGQPEPETNPAAPAPPAVTTFAVTPIPKKESFHLYLLMGQSNMAGRDRSKLAEQVANPHVLTLTDDGKWIVARDPIHSQQGRVEPGAGPGISFAKEMSKADPKITIGLIPCAVGGSPLKRWVKGGDLYQIAVQRAKAAAQVGTVKGVLWHQGETDTLKKETADSYETRLTQMIKDLRADLNQPELPVVVGQLGDFLSLTSDKYPFVDTVRSAIKHMPEVVQHVGYADSAGLEHQGDKLHFNADAAKELGTRYAKAMQGLQK